MCCLLTFVTSSCYSLKNKNETEQLKDQPIFWTDGLQEDSSEARAMRGVSFLKQNALVKGVRKHRSGMQSSIKMGGKGSFPGINDIVTVRYKMKTIEGTLLDDSSNDNELAEFRMADVIDGWKEALVKMRVGSEWRLFIPPHLAYGDEGLAQVQGGQTLIYDLELVGAREDSKVTQGRRLRLLKRIKVNKVKGTSEKGGSADPGLLLDNLDLIE
jgi:FKBP-type peptidyl-prolyl cis-trans isomerase FklB